MNPIAIKPHSNESVYQFAGPDRSIVIRFACADTQSDIHLILYLFAWVFTVWFSEIRDTVMDFSQPPPGANAGKLDPAQKDALMSQVKQQIAVANAKELLQVNILLTVKFAKISHKNSFFS